MTSPIDPTGTPGDDVLLPTAGNGIIDAGAGIDTIDMTNAGNSGSLVDLVSGTAFSTSTGIDQISNFENVRGSDGDDGLFGNGGDNVFFATQGTDVIDGRGGSDTFDASGAPSDITANLTTGDVSQAVTATLTNIENIATGAGNDLVTGTAGANRISTGDGFDRVTTAGGSDVVDAGAGTDTVAFGGARADYTVTWNGSEATVSNGTDTVTITNAERLEFTDKSVLLVSATGTNYGTIQSAVNECSDGDEILVGAGTYTEQVMVTAKENLLIKATGVVTIEAPADVDPTVVSSAGRALNAVVTVVNSTNVVLDGFTVDGAGAGNSVNGANANFVGVVYRNSSGGLTDVDVTGIHDAYPGGTTIDGFAIQSGNQRGIGIQVDNGTILDFFMHGGSISDFQKNATVFNGADLDVSGVTITGGGAQTVNAQNGFQVLNSTGTLTGNTIEHIGYAGTQIVYSGAMLLYGNTDLNVTDNTITGSNDATPDGKVVGIYVLDFGTPNSGGAITGNIISFVDEGIDVSGNLGPHGIVIEGNTITDLDLTDTYVSGVYFAPNSAATPYDVDGSAGADFLQGGSAGDLFEGLAGNDFIDGAGGQDTLLGGEGNDAIVGGAGNDSIVGGDGADNLDGGTGNDVIVADAADTVVGGDNTDIVVLADGVDPADIVVAAANFTGVELIQTDDPAGSRTYVVLDGMSIQAAIDAASDGDTILVAPGSYTSTANYNPSNNTNDPGFTNPVGMLINKGVTIAGVDATGALITSTDDIAASVTAGVESNWGTSFFVTAAGVTITGLSFIAAAPGGVSNKAFEIVEDGFTLAHSVVGSAGGDIGATIYVNDDVASADPDFVSDIQSFFIHDNVLKGDFVLANGAGFGHAITDLRLEDNDFVLNLGASLDWNWGVIITGRDDAVAWRIQSVGELIVTGNTFSGDYTVDRLLYVRDDDPARLPSAQFVQDFLTNNGITSFSYAVDSMGVPSRVDLGTTYGFVLAMTAGNGSAYANEGDTLIVQTEGTPASETIVTDELSIDLRSAGLSFEMDGGVAMLSLLGSQDGDIIGNSLDNTITGNDGDNVLVGAAGDDSIDAGGGDDMVDGGAGSDDLSGGDGDDTFFVQHAADVTATDVIDGGAGTDTVLFADMAGGTLTLTSHVTGIEAVTLSSEGLLDTAAMSVDASDVGNALAITGNLAANQITGTAFADTINGGGGNDSIAGNGGNDQVDGGAGMDVVAFEGDRDDYTVTWNGTSATVSDGTDTVTIAGAGQLQFADKAVLLVANGSSEYATIQSAVNAAASGDEILVAAGSYAGATITDKAISIAGSEAGVTVNGSFSVSDDMAASDEMRFANMTINAAGQVQGIVVRSSSADIVGVNGGSIVLDGVTIENAREHGFLYALQGNGSVPVNGNTVGNISILNSHFLQNGETYTGAKGQGHVNLFGFNGNLTVTDSDFISSLMDLGDGVNRGGTVGVIGAPVNADKAFSVTGIRTGVAGVGGYVNAGTLVMDGVNVQGYYSTDAVSFYTIQAFAGISFTDVNVTARALWALINFDSVSGPIDLSSGFTGTNLAPFEVAELQGLATADAITGTAGADLLYGRGGADTLMGGEGNDLFVYTSSAEFAAGEVVNGGGGTDSIFFGTGAADTLVLSAAVTGIETVFLNTAGGGNLVAMNVNASAVGNGLTIVGNGAANSLTGTAFADVISGGDGNDVLSGGVQSDVLYGGNGADTLTGGGFADVLDGGAGGDVLNGGSGSDTASYATSTAGVAVDLEQSTAALGYATDDVLASIENLTGSVHADTLTGDGGANVITGNGGADVLDGGDGNDTVVFAGDWDDYVITRSGATYTVTAGAVSVSAANFETFVFGGVSYGVITDPDLIVTDAAPVIASVLEIGTDEDADSATFALSEGAANGAMVLRATATDPNTPLGDQVTFSLVDQFGNAYTGPFAVMANGAGAAKVVLQGVLDYEAVTSLSFVVRATDARGNYDDQAVTVAVLDVNEAPGNGAGLVPWTPSVQAGTAHVALTPAPVVVDPEGDTLTYTLAANASEGQFYNGSTLVTVGMTLTAAEFAGLTYVAPETAGVYSGASFTVSDGANDVPLAVAITVTAGIAETLTGDALANVLDGGAADDTLLGAEGDDTMYGGSGKDALSGGAGADALYGGSGTDSFSSGLGADQFYGGAGNDTAKYTKATVGFVLSLVNAALNTGAAEGDVLTSVENVTAGSGNDTITGDGVRNILTGGDGDDRLDGGLGQDQLIGGNGSDSFVFSAVSPTSFYAIDDFASGTDHLALSAAVFTAIGATLDADEFRISGTGARDANDFLFYRQTDGTLFYDADGSGAGSMVQIARLGAGTALVFADLTLF